jgi:hypothetical protein
MSIFGFNRKIACSPFARKSIEVKVQKGFGSVAQKLALTPLRVLFGNDDVPAGSVVYLRGDTMKQTWASEEFELDGQTVILVPQDQIQLVERA